MPTIKHPVVCLAAPLLAVVAANASVIVTQSGPRAYNSTWLLNPGGQQSIAHQVILAAHDVSPVAVFDDKTLADVDIVYLSPSLGELVLTDDEMAALEAYANGGGRVIVAADNSKWADDFEPFTTRFDVTYGDSFVNGVVAAVVLIPDNPIIDGPAGVAAAFNSASANDGLSSTNDDFEVVAEWEEGPPGLGYLAVGKGEIVFLSDFNTFDDDMINQLDNRILWSNLFASSVVACPEDLDGSGAVDFGDVLVILAEWGPCEEGPCLEDLDGSGAVDFGDILVVLANWGPCG